MGAYINKDTTCPSNLKRTVAHNSSGIFPSPIRNTDPLSTLARHSYPHDSSRVAGGGAVGGDESPDAGEADPGDQPEGGAPRHRGGRVVARQVQGLRLRLRRRHPLRPLRGRPPRRLRAVSYKHRPLSPHTFLSSPSLPFPPLPMELRRQRDLTSS
jgi:hypothetical protein